MSETMQYAVNKDDVVITFKFIWQFHTALAMLRDLLGHNRIAVPVDYLFGERTHFDITIPAGTIWPYGSLEPHTALWLALNTKAVFRQESFHGPWPTVKLNRDTGWFVDEYGNPITCSYGLRLESVEQY